MATYTGKRSDSNKYKSKIRKYSQEISILKKKCRSYILAIRNLKKKIDQ